MSSQNVTEPDWNDLPTHIHDLERQGVVTRTFRRLDPERQEEVVNAILEEAAEKGPASLNIKQVAERAKASIGSLYQYFGSREGLLRFAISLVVRTVVGLFKLSRPYLVAMPLREALKAYLIEGVKWSKAQMGLTRFFARAAYHGDPELAESVVRPIATIMRETMHDILTQAAVRGEIRADVDLEATARVVNALMIALGDPQLLPYLNTYFQVTDKTMPPERVLDAALGMILRGIGTETR